MLKFFLNRGGFFFSPRGLHPPPFGAGPPPVFFLGSPLAPSFRTGFWGSVGVFLSPAAPLSFGEIPGTPLGGRPYFFPPRGALDPFPGATQGPTKFSMGPRAFLVRPIGPKNRGPSPEPRGQGPTNGVAHRANQWPAKVPGFALHPIYNGPGGLPGHGPNGVPGWEKTGALPWCPVTAGARTLQGCHPTRPFRDWVSTMDETHLCAWVPVFGPGILSRKWWPGFQVQ